MEEGGQLRLHLVNLLEMKGAHLDYRQAVEGLTAQVCGRKITSVPYSIWQILEHMRIAQWDILCFSQDSSHVSPEWPDGYWPPAAHPPSQKAVEKSIQAFLTDLESMKDLIKDPESDLFTPIAHGEGQTLLREALILAAHNSYHLGQLVLLRRSLKIWPE